MTEGGDGWAYSNRFGPAGSEADDPRYDDEFGAARTDRYDDDRQAGPNGWGGDDRQADPHGWPAEFNQPGYGGPGRAQRPGDPYYEPGHGEQDRYGGHDVYGGAGAYRDPGGYGPGDGQRLDRDAYRGWSDYGDPGEYRDRGDYGHPASHQGDQGGYDSAPTYRYEGYAPPEPYGRTGYGGTGSYDPYGPVRSGDDPYGDGAAPGPDARATAAYDWAGEGQPTDPHAPQPYRRAGSEESGSYHAAGAFGTDAGSFGRSDSGQFGRDSGSFDPADSGSFGRTDSGSFGRPDTGSFGRTDSGSFGRPDSGQFGRDSGSFDPADSGSFGRTDSGSFGRPDTGPFGRNTPGREEVPLPSRGALPAGSDGYAQWHSDPSGPGSWDVGDDRAAGEDEWADDLGDDDNGQVSRILARGRRGRGGDEPGGGRRQGRRPKRRRRGLALIVAILAGALVLGMVADFGYQYVHKWITNRYGDYAGGGHGTVRVTVPPGSSLSQLGPTLLKDGVIMALRPYDSAAGSAPNAASLQPGVYQLKHQMNAALAVAALLNPKNRVKDQITIIEGWRASRIAATLAKQTGISASQFTNLIDHPPASLGLPKWAAGRSAEGFLFPDTYTLLPHMTALQILQTMVKDFNQRTASLRLPVVAPQKSVTPYQILIAASLIQAEAGNPSDFGKISRVIWNRIQQHMKLDFDSTVFYAMGTYGTYVKTPAQKNFNSKYNTYKYFGLPPGPIDSPGLAAIQAALHAPQGSELYFITDLRHKPYVTHFTSSYKQFQQWQLEFQG